MGHLDGSRDGSLTDLSGLNYNLENGTPANLLGALGSAITWSSGHTFLALPDRGPNAMVFDAYIDNTVSYVNRFPTITMHLKANKDDDGLPFTLSPHMQTTTLLWSSKPLLYSTGAGWAVGSGVPPINNLLQNFFTGRPDGFDPSHNSGNLSNARLDSEGLRVSNDGLGLRLGRVRPVRL